MWKIAILFTLPFILLISSQNQIDCNKLPPALWCQSEELTRKCNFSTHCQTYKRSTRGSKIKLTVLFSSLCWYSRKFIKEVLYPKIYTNFSNYVDIELVPFGNANRTNDGEIHCKRGVEECQAHLFITCAQKYMVDILPLVYCLESNLKTPVNTERAIQKCYDDLKIGEKSRNEIEVCRKGDEGRQLQQVDAIKTEDVWPDWSHSVPWILFNNVSLSNLQEDNMNLQFVLCKLYLLGEKPSICNQ